MTIDLDRFSKKKKAIVPIIKNLGMCDSRRFYAKVDDGFYNVELGDYVKILDKADIFETTQMLDGLPSINGFLFGSELVPESFNTAKLKFSLSSSSIPVSFFMEAAPWSFVKAVMWEDGNWFVTQCLMTVLPALLDVVDVFEKDKDLKEIKGVTPEMRYLFFLFSFERNATREMEKLQRLAIAEEDRKKRLEEFRRTVGGRLKESIEKAGGHLVRFQKYGRNKLEVVWILGSEQFNSLINANTFQCEEAGFCVSGDDKKLNIGAAVLTARDYIQGRNGTVEYAVLKDSDVKRCNSGRSLIHKTRE